MTRRRHEHPKLKRGLAVTFVVALFLPMFQRSAKVFPRPVLHGVERRIDKPRWSSRGWLDQSFQSQYEQMFSERLGFRECLIKTYNQINFSLFRKMPGGRGTRIVAGRNNMLYEKVYVDSYNMQSKVDEGTLKRVTAEVRALQHALAEHGIAFVLVIAPNKVEIYPEHVPAGVLAPGRDKRRSTYQLILPYLREAGIHMVDSHRLFKDRKETDPSPLFARGGVHWNYYGAGLVAANIMTMIQEQLGRPVPQLHIRDVRTDYTVHGSDNDLGNLLNLWNTRFTRGPQVHPVFDTVADGSAAAPDILFVGDSFVFTLAEIVLSENLCRKHDTLFYYKRRFVIPRQGGDPLDHGAIDWEQELLARDAVVIEINEYWLPAIGFGFIPDALKALSSREAGGRGRGQEAGGRRQGAGGRGQEAGGRRTGPGRYAVRLQGTVGSNNMARGIPASIPLCAEGAPHRLSERHGAEDVEVFQLLPPVEKAKLNQEDDFRHITAGLPDQ